MRIAPDTQTWFEQWAVDGLWFTRDHAWYSFTRPVDLDFNVGSFSLFEAECIPSVWASADSCSLGLTESGTESLVDSFSEISCTFSYSENVGVALRNTSILDTEVVAQVAGFNVGANADSYSLGVTDSGAESLVDSFSQPSGVIAAVVEANAGSYSFGVTDSGGEALTDSFSQIECVVAVDIPNTVFGVTSSVSRATAQVSADISLRADAQSYSFGVGDTDTDSLADSFSQTSATVTNVAASVAGVTVSSSGLGVITGGDTSVSATATGTSRSVSAVAGQAAATGFAVRADVDSYSFGVGDTDTDSLADSFSQTTADVNVAVSVAGSTSSTSSLGVTSGSNTSVTGTATGTSRSASVLGGQAAATEFSNLKADVESYSFGVGDTDTDSLTDSFSQTSATVTNVAVSVAGSTASSSSLGVTSGSSTSVTGNVAGTSSSVSAPAVVSSSVLAVSRTGTSDSRSAVTGQAAATGFAVRADVQSYSFGVGDTDTDSLTDSFSQTTAAVNVVMAYSGTSASKSTAAVTSTNVIAVSVAGTSGSRSAPAVTSSGALAVSRSETSRSVSTVTGQAAATGFAVRADVQSYSFGVGDTDTDSLTDSFSQTTAAVNVVMAYSGTSASKSTAAVTNTNVIVANVAGTTASKSTAAVANTNVIAANFAGTVASKSTAAVTNTNVVVANVAGTVASKSAPTVTSTNVIVASAAGTTASKSAPTVTSTNVIVASAAGTTASKSTNIATNTNVIVTSRTGTTASKSTNTATNTNVIVASRTGAAVSKSTAAVTSSNVIVTSRAGTTASRSTVSAPTVAITALRLGANAISEGDPESDTEISQVLQIDTSQAVNIPAWAKKVDALVVGGGGGSTGSASLSYGVGGAGGQWAYASYDLGSLLETSGYSAQRYTAVFTVGDGGAGGAGTGLGSLVAGKNGTPSTVVVNAVTDATSRPLANLNAPGGLGSTVTNTLGITQSQAQPGKPVTGGNANSGKDVSLNGSYWLNNAWQTVYAGGGQAAANSAAGAVPGGGGAGKNAGNVAGSTGGKGRGFIRFFSASKIQQQNWTTPGSYTRTLPLDTEKFAAVCVGGGGGGAGGTGSVTGEGGSGSRWARTQDLTMLPQIPWELDVTALLTKAGLTRDQINQLSVDVSVGRGGFGSDGVALGLGNPGGNGLNSSVTLKCRRQSDNTQVTLVTITSTGGAGNSNSVITDRPGKPVTGGNTNSSKDLVLAFSRKQFSFYGGAATPQNIFDGSPGNPPGGGGSGGGLGLGALLQAGGKGSNGGNGAAYIVFL